MYRTISSMVHILLLDHVFKIRLVVYYCNIQSFLYIVLYLWIIIKLARGSTSVYVGYRNRVSLFQILLKSKSNFSVTPLQIFMNLLYILVFVRSEIVWRLFFKLQVIRITNLELLFFVYFFDNLATKIFRTPHFQPSIINSYFLSKY